MLRVVSLRTEHQVEPLGIDETVPVLGWQIVADARDVLQTGFRIRAALSQDALVSDDLVWDSGWISSARSVDVVWAGPALESRTRYFWDVEVETTAGSARAEEPTWFEMGLLEPSDWTASWGRPSQLPRVSNPPVYDHGSMEDKLSLPIPEDLLRPAQYMRRAFEISGDVVRARVYATAHGVYRLELNGVRVGDRELAPEWTSYHKRLQYQTYDVTEMLRPGENVLGMVVADGWWAGRLGVYGEPVHYGKYVEGLWQIEIEHADGSRRTLTLDRTATSHEGPVRYSDLMIGESIDLRRAIVGWSEPGFDDSGWMAVQHIDRPLDELVASDGEPVRVVERFPSERIVVTPKGEIVVDFGRVVAGRASATLVGESGDVLRLEYTETLDENGCFFSNIGWRPFGTPTDTFILAGTGEPEIFDPAFTYRGFRYARLTGTPELLERLRPDDLEAVSLSSDTRETLRMTTSNEDVNALLRNIKATHRANMLSVPADNPDRERAGWTGDFHAIAPSVMTTTALQPLTRRWIKDLIADQRTDGGIPQVVPAMTNCHSVPLFAWGDVCVLGPWEAFCSYGDTRLLSETYEMAEGWMRWSERQALASQSDEDRTNAVLSHVWRPVEFGFGDWLTPSMLREAGDRMFESTGQVVSMIPTLYWCNSARVMARIAAVLGKGDDAARYAALAERIDASFCGAFVQENGLLTEDKQANYVLAIRFRMGTDAQRQVWLDRLVTLIHSNGDRLDTGFLSTAHLLPVLTEGGHGDLAVSLLLSEEHPGWLYMLRHGATSVWESWSAVTPEDGHVLRTSFIQPGLSTVGVWLARHLAGISPAAPGFQEVLLRPVLDPRIPSVRAVYETPYGPVAVRVDVSRSGADLHVSVPANARAVLDLPSASAPVVRDQAGTLVEAVTDREGRPVIGSGEYVITVPGL